MEELVGNVETYSSFSCGDHESFRTAGGNRSCCQVNSGSAQRSFCFFFPQSEDGQGQQQVCHGVCGVGDIQSLTRPRAT